jgi:hypothetical protein
MAKRFGDTDIWKKQRWFRKLIPEYKLAFLYIKDQCDHAGIWNIECTDLVEDLGIESFSLTDFVNSCNVEYDKNTGEKTLKERIRLLDKGYAWVTGFIQFQYKGKEGLVNPYAAPVKTALQILIGYKLLEDAINNGHVTLTQGLSELPEGFLNFPEGLPNFREGFVTPKEKDKDKDKEGLTNNAKIKNGSTTKFSGNFKAQGEELLAQRYSRGQIEADRNGKENNKK